MCIRDSIKQGVACAVEGDIKVAMAMSILKTIAGTGQLSEMYSIDFDKEDVYKRQIFPSA